MNYMNLLPRLAQTATHRICVRYGQFLLTLSLSVLALSTKAQSVGIAGPQCVIAGPIYLYNITGQWQAGSTVRVCVTNGTLVDSGGTCAGGGGILSFVRVNWDSGATSGTIAVTSSLGNSSISVSITAPLAGGQLDSAVATQSVDTLTTPATLTGSMPTGGACQPAYALQWQQSWDNVTWWNITGATDGQYIFSGPLNQTSYFRRVVNDNNAQVLAYSNIATIYVNAPMPTSSNLQTSRP